MKQLSFKFNRLVCSKLKLYRVAADMTQDELAEKLQCTQVWVHRMENGTATISDDLAVRLRKLFGDGVIDAN